MSEPRQEVVSHTLVQMGVWIELFYDLVFVAAILVFSSAVSHLHDGARIGWVVVVFSAVWWVWLSTTIFANRFRMTDPGHRVLILLQMFFVVLIAMEARAGVVDDEAYLTATYGLLIGTVAGMYWRAAHRGGPDAQFARWLAVLNTTAAACFVLVAPWLARNWIEFDRPVLISTNDGSLLAGANCDQTYYGKDLGLWTTNCLSPRVFSNEADQAARWRPR